MQDATLIYWVEEEDGLVNGVRVFAGKIDDGQKPVYSYVYLIGSAQDQLKALGALRDGIETRITELKFGVLPPETKGIGTVKILKEFALLS
jgi:hypothetical protein